MSRNPASWIIQDRVDMTDWVLHFVHETNLGNEPTDDLIPFERYEGMPYHVDPEVNSRFCDWDYMDEYIGWGSGASAFGVLRKIILDGHIRSTWAFRNGRPTIYGPRAAVCVTEMPLHALVDYAKLRDSTDVECYAIGLLKSEFFAAGGRPAIYGLSTRHAKRFRSNQNWPRTLDGRCGIAETEQYRYVATALGGGTQIDWTHEREWRWVDHHDSCWCPGLPVWLADQPNTFSQIFVVVPSTEEAETILDLLKELHDVGANGFDVPFEQATLEQTAVISLEQVRDNLPDDLMRTLRFEDIPKMHLRKFESPQVGPEVLDKLRRVLLEAKDAAKREMHEVWEAAPKGPDGHIRDVVGYASLSVHDAQSPLVAALLELGEANPLGGEGYFISDIPAGCKRLDQALCLEEAAARAAKEVFETHYPENTFMVYSRWD